jgi:sugar phosphate isomerase/epimerase
MQPDISLEQAIKTARLVEADGFELRRELLPSNVSSDQWQWLNQQLRLFPSRPVYSTPQPLFKNNQFEQDAVLRSLDEAKQINCWLAKFSRGDEPEADRGQYEQMRTALHEWQQRSPDLQITVENGQSLVDRDLDRWVQFFQRVNTYGCNIRMTFDIGNWGCLGVDAMEAAQRLGQFVVYLHSKSVQRSGDRCISQPIESASIPHPVLSSFPDHIPRALEFPVAIDSDSAIATLRDYVDWLRLGKFVVR